MAKTKRNKVVTSNTKFEEESLPPPQLLKKQKDMVINEPSEAPRRSQPTSPQTSTQESVQPKNEGRRSDAPDSVPPMMLNSEPTASVQAQLAASVDDVAIDVEKADDDLAEKKDEEEMRNDEDEHGIA
uniref:Uncharacterized protein n=1 Tax=Solanum tuberosum TaxID=4113 RepID=M1DVT0_SOLTU